MKCSFILFLQAWIARQDPENSQDPQRSLPIGAEVSRAALP
jgi:hypothetical protein